MPEIADMCRKALPHDLHAIKSTLPVLINQLFWKNNSIFSIVELAKWECLASTEC